MIKTDLFGLFVEEIAAIITAINLPDYRARQIGEWLYRHNVTDFKDMTNLPLPVRANLAANFAITKLELKATKTSVDGETVKFLFLLPDGEAVETVIMRHNYGNSVCVSTQVGCAMGCRFCASTLNGWQRNLSAGEILAQVLYAQNLLSGRHEKVNSLVIMGSGEPLANYENVLRFIRLCHQPYCLNLGYRNITLSTAGLVPEIDRLAAENLPITLSISLHAPTNQLRNQLMPVNRKFPLPEVVAAGRRYAMRTGRRVTYEYVLIAAVNDRPEQAEQLARLLKGQLANINLIPVNPVPERNIARPGWRQINRFAGILQTAGMTVTVRREMGSDIRAACGQLRNKLYRK